MEGDAQRLVDKCRAVGRAIRRHARLAAASAWAVALAGALAVPQVPQRYESRARVQVDTQSVLSPLMSGLMFQTDLDRQVRVLARTVITGPNLARLLSRSELGLPAGTAEEREATLGRLLGRIKLSAEDGGIYGISYRDTSPELARRVVAATIELFAEVSEGGKTRDAVNANRFIEEQLRAHEAKLLQAEQRLTDFKVRHFGTTGVAKEDYFSRMSAIIEGVAKLRSELRAAEQARDVYRAGLAKEAPQTGNDVEIAGLRKQLDELLRRLGEQHPDVIAVRASIAELQGQRGRAETGGAATNPAYQRMKTSIAEAEAQVASLRSRLSIEEQRLEEVRARADKAPEIEAELAKLNLEYEFARKGYDQLMARREAALLGVKAEESSRLGEFRVIEPPRAVGVPVFPGHLHLALIVVVASLLAGVVAPLALELVRPTFDDAHVLRAAVRRPVLGTISLLPADAAPGRAGPLRRLWLAGATLLACQAVWLAWISQAGSRGMP